MKGLYDKLGVSTENRPLLTVMYFSFFVNGMMAVILGALLPYIRQVYQLDYTQSGLLLSAHQIGNLCAVVFAGVLPYLIGRKHSALLLGSGMFVGLLLMTLTGNSLLLIVAFLLTGIGRGNWSNICNTVIGEVSGNKTAALNILHAVFATGALLSPFLVLACVRPARLGWEGAARFVALLGALVLVLVARSQLPGRPAARNRGEPGDGRAVLRSASFWVVTGILFFYLGAEASIIGWFVTYFSESGILSPSAAAFTPTLLWAMIMAGRLTCAGLSKRFHKYRLILGMGILFSACFVLLLSSQNSWMCVLSLLGIGFFMAGIYPTTFSTIKNLSSTLANGLCIGIATFGAILMPGIVGRVADRRGLTGGIAVVFLCCIGMVALMIVGLLRSEKSAAGTAEQASDIR